MKRSLRIGLVCPYSFDRPGGVQNQVLGLAHYLRQQGHQPRILAPGEARLADVDFTSAGAAVPVPYNGSVARVNFGPVSAARVRRWLRAGGFDLLHIHEPITPSIALLALWAAEVPVVASYHTATPRSRTMQVAGELLRPSVEKITAGIAVSESARRVVVQHLGRDAVVIPNGFAHGEFAAAATGVRPEPWRGGSRPRITFLGRIDEPRKGLDVLLAAVPAIRAQVGEVDVAIAGHGTRRLPTGCRALGPLGDRDKVRLLARTDVFVAPHTERESFGIVLLEALAAGAEVVASDLPAFGDLLGRPDGALGQTFAVGDPAALAQATVRALREQRRQPAAAAVVARYDWSVVGAAVVEFYRTVVAGSAARPLGTWTALDSALARRARRAGELVGADDMDPATQLLVSAAAAAALRPGLSVDEREQAENELSRVLRGSGLTGVSAEQQAALLARRLHNDAVVVERERRRRLGETTAAAGHGSGPRTFEMTEL